MGDPIAEAAARKGSAEILILAVLEEGQLHGAGPMATSPFTSRHCTHCSTDSRIEAG